MATIADPGTLRNLSISNVSEIPELSCEELRSLKIALNDQCPRDSRRIDRLSQLLFRSHYIEDLDLTGATVCMDAQLLDHLGKSLKSLRLHEFESELGPQRRPILSAEQVEALAIHCPNLEILGLDIGYNGQWVCEMKPIPLICAVC